MAKTDIRATCPICEKELDARGLKGHKRLAHGVGISQEKRQEGSQKEKEGKTMPETTYCPGCDEKKDTIRDLKAAAEKAEAAHAQALQGKTHEVEGLTAQVASLKAQVEAAKKVEPVPGVDYLPSVDEFVEHCKTCDKVHKPQLRQFMDKVKDTMSKDEVAKEMKRVGIAPAPEKIVIGIRDR